MYKWSINLSWPTLRILRLHFCSNSYNKSSRMAAIEVLRRLETRAVTAEQMIENLKKEVAELKQEQHVGDKKNEVLKLQNENEQLKKEIEKWKQKLITLESSQNIKQVPIPKSNAPASQVLASVVEKKDRNDSTEKPVSSNKKDGKTKREKVAEDGKKEEKSKKVKGGEKSGEAEEPPLDVGRLDFRVGRIVAVKKHPDADSLYVEEIDVGETKPRTVVSGLVKFVPINEMENRMVVLLCNLKPAKMRGVMSEAMVMCASTPEKVEILIPPQGSVPGDLVHVEGFPRSPDSVLNPKKKIFETVAPDLKTNDDKIATYKGAPFTVPGKGTVIAPSLIGVNIK